MPVRICFDARGPLWTSPTSCFEGRRGAPRTTGCRFAPSSRRHSGPTCPAGGGRRGTACGGAPRRGACSRGRGPGRSRRPVRPDGWTAVIAVDTNVLVYARRAESAHHARARRLLTALAEGEQPWAIPWPCVYEFLRVVTHPRIFDPPTDLETALEDLESLFESPSLALLGEGPSHPSHLRAGGPGRPCAGQPRARRPHRGPRARARRPRAVDDGPRPRTVPGSPGDPPVRAFDTEALGFLRERPPQAAPRAPGPHRLRWTAAAAPVGAGFLPP